MINFTDDIVYQPMSQPLAVESMAIDTVDDIEKPLNMNQEVPVV